MWVPSSVSQPQTSGFCACSSAKVGLSGSGFALRSCGVTSAPYATVAESHRQ